MLAFAANSVLCRAALGEGTIDAASFSSVRMLSGALALAAILRLRRAPRSKSGASAGSWRAAGWLCLYALPFSFAYEHLSTGTGALLLFGAVQLTMICAGLLAGERPLPLHWLGLALAVAGLVYLVLPGVSAPSLGGSALMATAGFAWGLYSLRGRGASEPLRETAGNFLRSVPLVLAVSLLRQDALHLSPGGLALAATSGALASGVGYSIWYAALPGLSASLAATVQLAVPVIAALGGVVFMGERIRMRLVLSSAAILGGVGLALWCNARAARRARLAR